ncbi:MAG: hypothetical protein DMG70_07330 [Acidobacteria bacterium]|nr:MAG: hypothetical protein DMG70_07330 [Acidobacteriota bacterium]
MGESKNANFPKDIHEDSLMGRILFGCDRHRVAMLVGGTSILRDIKPKLGAAAIIDFLAGVSPLMHDFWRREDPNQRMNDMINFTKNVAFLGGSHRPHGSGRSLADQPSGCEAKCPGTRPRVPPPTPGRRAGVPRRQEGTVKT